MADDCLELPHFVRKQVELATAKLSEALSPLPLEVSFHGLRVVIQELHPHPTQVKQIKVPMALLDYSKGHWQLLFRATTGHWQPVPGDAGSVAVDTKINAIIADPYQVFWRQ